MKFASIALSFVFAFLLISAPVQAGETTSVTATSDLLDPPRFEVAAESAYLMCILNNPHGYEVAAEFLTGRIRWGVVQSDNWTRGYQQFYVSGEVQPIVRGVENIYLGVNFGMRYNFVPRNSRWNPYISGGLGLGWIDSNAAVGGSQGQDFTFNILSSVGVAYRVNDRWKVNAGLLWEHFSNGGQTDPNPSLNLLGPQLAVSYTF